MRNRQGNNCIWRKAGFTLVETLLVVGILIALLALSIVAITDHVGDLRQLEMDAKAEQIYIAAQNRMTILRANGVEHKYQLRQDVTPLGYVPYDADMLVVGENTLSYVTSQNKNETDTAAGEILPSGCIDYAVWGNHWIIEYDPIGGTVYAVFYSEKEISTDAEYLDSMRVKSTRRRSAKGYLGYYGGDITVNEEVMQLSPYISFDNRETMSVTYVCRAPKVAAGQQVYFDITIRAADGTGGVYSQTLTAKPSGRDTFMYTLVLDDLNAPNGRFRDICENSNVAFGKDLIFYVYARSSNDTVLPGEYTEENNALFAYDTKNGADGTAVIRFARHLQNLDSSSGVVPEITKAVQAQDIDFSAEGREGENPWYLTSEFTPISNKNLISYNGQNAEKDQYVIRNLRLTGTGDSNTGLFKTLYKGTYQNIYLIGSTISSAGNAGTLAGAVESNVTLKNCRSYLEREMLVGKDQEDIWVSGINAGGLVGYIQSGATVNVSGCFAATVMDATGNAGGLVGLNEGALNITGSYADSYITAPTVGGLAVSSSTVTLQDTYAAGYLTSSQKAAGLVFGNATMKNSYAAISYLGTGDIFTTAESGSADNVLYLQAGSDTKNMEGTDNYTYVALSKRAEVKALLGDQFVATASQTFAYNLMGQGVSEYSFPALAGLPHYGDWDAEFESGKLVYYEEYDGGSYGFFGANMDTLNDSGYAVGDGYGIVYDGRFLPDEAKIFYGDSTTGELISDLNWVEVEKDNKTYRIYQLPKSVVNALGSNGNFYRQLRVGDEDGGEEVFYYNPSFAKTVISGEASTQIKGDIIIRTARQLHLLSLEHLRYYSQMAGKTFVQELDISYSGSNAYDWAAYWGTDDTADGTPVTQQGPIGENSGHPFVSNYDGGSHKILNLNIVDKKQYVGLFGYVKTDSSLPNSGKISNVVLIAENNKGVVGYGSGISSPDDTFYIGALVANNEGLVENCAVAGYSTKLYVYNNSNAYLGGLVGSNGIGGEIIGCSVSSIGTALNINDSSAYVGGFVGVNYGYIDRCYSVGTLEVVASKNASTTAAGFAARNPQAQIHSCYCATALTASGDVESCAFVPRGGDVNMQCAYLANGAYFMGGELYAFHSASGNSLGSGYNNEYLKELDIPGFADEAEIADFHYHSEGSFQYPAVVTNAQGQYVHYGEWPQEVNMGESGVFYWEQEYGGNNDGYHLSYLGMDGSEIKQGSNLCDSHDDYGNIIRYGYGYYYRNDTSVSKPSAFGSELAPMQDVNAELQKNMPEYTFVAYESGMNGSQLKLKDKNANMTVAIGTGAGKTVTYTISPFFADAMSVANQAAPGTAENPYMIRSPEQIQFINWNYGTGRADDSIYTSDQQAARDKAREFTYLNYVWGTSANNLTTNQGNSYNYYWKQSHDVDFGHDPAKVNEQKFTPIGSLYDHGSSDSDATIAYFAGSYSGEDYIIRNINISSNGECVGLFGVTLQANLQKIVLYSDQGNVIQNTTDGNGWYCIGGLVGFAGKGTTAGIESTITNCTVAGYTIIDNRKDTEAYGGTNIGGLVGATNMPISGCSAVTDIIVQLDYVGSGRNIRVGGIAGSCPTTVTNCYAGGSVVSKVNPSGKQLNIWVGGIAGGCFIRTNGTIKEVFGDVGSGTTVTNCYSYVQIPATALTTNRIAGTHSLAISGDNLEASRNPVVNNSYSLASAVVNADDYKGTSTKTTTINNNGRPAYLTYEQMSGDTLRGYLGDAFNTVTIEENGAPIPGKYSFPAADQELTGHNYPFPTILTQVNRFSMTDTAGTVNVHYGAWPKDGLYWDRSEVNLDIFVHKDESSYETVKITMNNMDDANVNMDSFTYENVDGGTNVAEVVNVSGPITDNSGVKYFEVTLKPLRKGSVEIQLTDGPSIQVHVTADIRITATPDTLKLLALGQNFEEVSTELVATNRNGEPLDAMGLTWTVKQVHDDTIASIDEKHLGERTDKNAITVPVAGHAEGETFFTVDLTYLYNGVLYDDNYSALVPINVKAAGVVGLAGINDKDQKDVPDGNGSESQFEIPEEVDASLVLYSDRGLDGFQLGQLTVGGQPVDYVLGQRGTVGDMDYVVLVPALAQDYDSTDVTLSLTRHGVSYTLELQNVTLTGKWSSGYNVTFDANGGTVNGKASDTLTMSPGDSLPTPVYEVPYTIGTLDPFDFVQRFVGWYNDGTPITSVDQVSEDMTLKAEWEYTVLIINQTTDRWGATTYEKVGEISYTTLQSDFTTQNLNGYAYSAQNVTIYQLDGSGNAEELDDAAWTWNSSGNYGNRTYTVTIYEAYLTGPIVIIV